MFEESTSWQNDKRSHTFEKSSSYGCLGNFLHPSGTNPYMNNTSQTGFSPPSAVGINFLANDPSLHSSAESDSAPIELNGALSEQRRTSDHFWLGRFPYLPQESNCNKNDENCNRVEHSSSNLPKSDSVNPQSVRFNHLPVKWKLNFHTNIKDLSEWDCLAKVANVHLQTKKLSLSGDKRLSLQSPMVNVKDKYKARAFHSTSPQVKISISEWQDTVRENAVTSLTNLEMHLSEVRQQRKRRHNNESFSMDTECPERNKTVYSNNDVEEENVGNVVSINFAIPVKDAGTHSEHLSPSAVNNNTYISPCCAVNKTPERKQPEDSLKHIKKLQSPHSTPKRRINFSPLRKRRYYTPQSNKIDKYFIRKEMEHSGTRNSEYMLGNAFESDGYTLPDSLEDGCVVQGQNHSSLYAEVDVMKSKPSHKIRDDDVVIIDDETGICSRNSSETTNCTAVARNKHSYSGCKQVIKTTDDQIRKDGKSISSNQAIVSVAGVTGICSFREEDKIANASSRNCSNLSEASGHVKGKQLDSVKPLQPHIIGSENVDNLKDSVTVSSGDVDSIIIISDESDSDCVIERRSEERECVMSPYIYVLDEDDDSQGIKIMEDTKSTAILSDGSCTGKAHHSETHNVISTKSLAQENMDFTHRRRAVMDSPSTKSVSVNSFNVQLVTVDSPTNNPAIVSSPSSEIEIVYESVFVSGSSEQEILTSPGSELAVLGRCGSKLLVVNYSGGDSVSVNSKLTIDSIRDRESIIVSHAKNDSVLTTSSGKKALMSSISAGEMVDDDNQSRGVMHPDTGHLFVSNLRGPLITNGSAEKLVIVNENVQEPVVFGGCGRKPEAADRPSRETVTVGVSDREPIVIDRLLKEPMVVDEYDRKTVIVDKFEKEPVMVSALNKEPIVIGNLDKKLVPDKEKESVDDRTIMASCIISDGDSRDSAALYGKDTFQNIVQVNVQSYRDSSDHDDKLTNERKPLREGKVREVKPEQVIMSYQAVMYKHHDNAAVRMGLKWLSICCLDPYSCVQHHKNTLYKPFEVCDARTQIMEALMHARQWSYAFDFCCSVTSERSFPSASAVLRILDFILNTHNIDLIGCAVSAFKKIVHLHPPCAPDMLRYYTSILTDTLGEETPQISTNGIVQDVISRLNGMSLIDLQSENSPCHSLDVHEDTFVTQNTSYNSVDDSLLCEEHLDFSADERAEADRNYKTLKHSEKLDRLFLILEIIVELFEVDLSVFLVKRSFHPQKALSLKSYRPLIVSVLWRTSTVRGIGYVNDICRRIIALYAKCFVHKIDFNKRNVVARLLNLVAEAVRASECNKELMYPYFGERCETLAQEVSQCMSSIDPEDLVQALSDMMPSFLTLYVTNSLLSNALGYETTPSLSTVVELVQECFLPHEVKAEKMSPEMCAASNCKLIELKRNINRRDMKGETILHHVCRKNNVGKLKVLLEDPDIDVNAKDNFGWTPLHEAVHSGGVDCIRELLEYKPPPGHSRVDMRVQSEDGTTPLIDAVQSNQLESCKLLLKYGGASLLKDKNQDGKNALDEATSPEILALLESVRIQDEFTKGEQRWQHNTYSSLSPLIPLLLPIMLRSYLDTYQTLHIVNDINSRLYHNCANTVHTERKGRPNLKFVYARFLEEYSSFKKLKNVIRNERKKMPDNEMINTLLLLLHD